MPGVAAAAQGEDVIARSAMGLDHGADDLVALPFRGLDAARKRARLDRPPPRDPRSRCAVPGQRCRERQHLHLLEGGAAIDVLVEQVEQEHRRPVDGHGAHRVDDAPDVGADDEPFRQGGVVEGDEAARTGLGAQRGSVEMPGGGREAPALAGHGPRYLEDRRPGRDRPAAFERDREEDRRGIGDGTAAGGLAGVDGLRRHGDRLSGFGNLAIRSRTPWRM